MVGLCREGADTSEKKVTDVVPSAMLGNIAPYVLVPPRASILGAELWSFVPLCLLLFSRYAFFFCFSLLCMCQKFGRLCPASVHLPRVPSCHGERSMQLTDHVI